MPLDLTIVTPEGEVYAGPVDAVVLPGVAGDFGVLAGHERLLSPLRIGEAEIVTGERRQWAAMSDGFAEVSDDRVTVMVDTCELAADIDVARAEHARERAERELESLRRQAAENRDFKSWEGALARALARINVAKRV
jgi:F-type H+-transporting ATPase subunit epsilon